MTDRPSVAEIAALTARLRTLSNAGRDADPDEVDRFLADKREVLDRIGADWLPGPPSGYTRSALQAAQELAAEGRLLAEAMVRGYLDDVAGRTGVPVHQWGLDERDLEEIRTDDARHTQDAVQHVHAAITNRPSVVEAAVEPAIVEEQHDEAGFW